MNPDDEFLLDFSLKVSVLLLYPVLLSLEATYTTVFLSGKFHGQRCLADSSPWGHKKRVRHILVIKQQYILWTKQQHILWIYKKKNLDM